MALKLSPRSVITSNSGMKMPVLGLGTLVNTDQQELETALDAALDAGYRHFDTAYVYHNEAAIGKVLKKWFDSGRIKREELFIVTKLWRTAMHEKYVEESLTRQLADLQLTYVDLYLIHSPVGFVHGDDLFPKDEEGNMKLDMTTDLEAVWKAMERQVDAGRTKFIGVSTFNIEQLERIRKIARIMPSTNQIECHLYLQEKELREWAWTHGSTVTAFSPFGSPGIISMLQEHGIATEKQITLNPLKDPTVVRIAESHKRTPGQVLLRHLLQLGVSAIPKSSNPERIRQNFQVFDFELSEKEMAELNALDKGEDGRKFGISDMMKGCEKHPEYPFKS
ncbi:hypothetical protein J6590_046689 [Homalodisca vitripennis]|nr:hypothetical protein J6590_046689 [Homalodisca vitripennis]